MKYKKLLEVTLAAAFLLTLPELRPNLTPANLQNCPQTPVTPVSRTVINPLQIAIGSDLMQ